MATLTKCPHCGGEIESDSTICDQCGEQLMICSKCGKFIKGKFCPDCGGTAIKASEAGMDSPAPAQTPASQPIQAATPISAQQQPQQPIQQAPVQRPIQQPQTPIQQYPPQQAIPSSYPPQQSAYGYQQPMGQPQHTGTCLSPNEGMTPSALTYRALGITLMLQNGAIIGRVTGNYTPQLCQLGYISGTHARVDFNNGNWTITDLGSRNGTTVNGMPCMPNQPVQINKGDTVRIARMYDFIVI